jgi:hypothetical protein
VRNHFRTGEKFMRLLLIPLAGGIGLGPLTRCLSVGLGFQKDISETESIFCFKKNLYTVDFNKEPVLKYYGYFRKIEN